MSYNFQLTKKEVEIASWAIEAMELNLVDIDSDEVGYKASDIPLVGRGMMFIGSPFALNDLLYRVEDQYIDMAQETRRNEGENTTQDIRYAKSLAAKIKKAIDAMSRPFSHVVDRAKTHKLITTKDHSIFYRNDVFIRHCQAISFERCGYGVFASTDVFGFYEISISKGGWRRFHVSHYISNETPKPPFYLWIKQMLEMAGLK